MTSKLSECDINGKNRNGDTPLYLATTFKKEDTIRRLTEKNAVY